MTRNNTFTAIALTALLASGSALANPDNETDLLQGGASVQSSPAEIYQRPFNSNDQQGDALYDPTAVPGVSKLSPFERISANPDISTDLVYGS